MAGKADSGVGLSNLINRRALPSLKLLETPAPPPLSPPRRPDPYVATHGAYAPPPAAAAGGDAVDAAIGAARDRLLALRDPEGFWLGELEADATLNAEYVMFHAFLGIEDPETVAGLGRRLRDLQLEDGGWGLYPGAPADLSATVEAIFALRLAGARAGDPALEKARDLVLSRGGIMKARILTKIFLAYFGQFDWRGLPLIPVEWMFMPRISAFNIYEFACWARAYTIPLMILNAKRPFCRVPSEAAVDDLYAEPEGLRDFSFVADSPLFSWKNFFGLADKVLKILERNPWKISRGWALRKAERWILEHQDEPGDWGGIFPAMMNSVMALVTLGYPMDHPAVAKGCAALRRLAIADGDRVRMQPCVSPVWDTAWGVLALLSAGVASSDARVQGSLAWLASRQIRRPGDWAVKAPDVEPGGWAFQFHNDSYPDIDDSSVVLMALAERQATDPAAEETFERGFRWVLGLQNDDGGFGAFERHVDNKIYDEMIFNDCRNMLDPSTPDVTARVAEMLGVLGATPSPGDPLDRAITFLRQTQRPEGCWFGRWGVNYVYGTWSALVALRAVGIPADDPMVVRASTWLLSVQNGDGGWGESPASYVDPASIGKGPSTPSQTAWAILGLVAAGAAAHPAAERGVRFLLSRQRPDGEFEEPEWTGTGFPGAFYLRYHLYRLYFPLMALARWQAAMRRS
ncbi:MAG: squalene--hopene cyclase [Planctomycetales bacterium]|nr:squalene--hopene cyclase [Planctomycetales bacterium]